MEKPKVLVTETYYNIFDVIEKCYRVVEKYENSLIAKKMVKRTLDCKSELECIEILSQYCELV